MKKTVLSLALSLALPLSAFASTIAIVDSGVDYKHKDIASQYKVNRDKIPGDPYVNDVYGYNLIENTPEVIDYSYLDKLKTSMPDIHKFFEVQTRMLNKVNDDNDVLWMKAMRDNPDFIKQLEIFGNFAHGTHVTGISIGYSNTIDKDNHPFMVKIIPTEVKVPGAKSQSRIFFESPKFQSFFKSGAGKITMSSIPASLRLLAMEGALRYLAKIQTKIFPKIGAYVNIRGSDVANGSFGTGYTQLRTIVEMFYNAVFKEDERNKQDLDDLTNGYMQQILIRARAMATKAPNTLFVFAAGNDGSNNDQFPSSPANLREDNTITVAATLGNRELASFSNYGTEMVDVAAPGVGITSTYPGDDHGMMSGTSQAAPYVTYVAASMKNLNPKLTPAQLKEILIGTVDAKDWLADKVKSGGFVNPERAKEAARLSNTLAINEAINQSRDRVKDMEVEAKPVPTSEAHSDMDIGIVQLPSLIN